MWSSAAWRVLLVLGRLVQIGMQRGPQGQRARAFDEAPLIVISMRRTSGCTMIGSAGLSWDFAPGQRAALQAVLRIGHGVLIGGLGQRKPCTPTPSRASFIMVNMAAHALVRLADQPAGRAVVVHHAGGVAVDAHLVFDRAARTRRCARPAMPSRSTRNFGTMNSEMPLVPSAPPGDARQHQMDDVVGQVVLAGRDEDLGAGDLVAAVGLRFAALVRIRPRSVPQCGSVRFIVPVHSPVIIFGR